MFCQVAQLTIVLRGLASPLLCLCLLICDLFLFGIVYGLVLCLCFCFCCVSVRFCVFQALQASKQATIQATK